MYASSSSRAISAREGTSESEKGELRAEEMGRSPTSPSLSSGAQLSDSDSLFSAVYDRLKSMAHRELKRANGHTLNTTALVHEAYVKISSGRELEFSDPGQFYLYAARAMRHILIDRARYRISLKAGGAEMHVTLNDAGVDGVAINPLLALHLDAGLEALERDDARVARVVELHYFAGLSLKHVAEILGVVRRTVDRDWRYARAFLLAQVG